MALLGKLDIDNLKPSRLWSELDAETRALAAKSMYAAGDEGTSRAEADQAIASTLRFRAQAVRQLPIDKRVQYLTRAVRPDDSLAASLLTALHLTHRKPMLEAFLDALGIPQEGGVIDAEHELETNDPQRLKAAVGRLRETFAETEVELYLATLLALDPESWVGLAQVVAPRSD